MLEIALSHLKRPIYTAENVRHGSDKSGMRPKKIVLISHLHVLSSTVLNDVKLCFSTGKRLNISASVLDSCLVCMRFSVFYIEHNCLFFYQF